MKICKISLSRGKLFSFPFPLSFFPLSPVSLLSLSHSSLSFPLSPFSVSPLILPLPLSFSSLFLIFKSIRLACPGTLQKLLSRAALLSHALKLPPEPTGYSFRCLTSVEHNWGLERHRNQYCGFHQSRWGISCPKEKHRQLNERIMTPNTLTGLWTREQPLALITSSWPGEKGGCENIHLAFSPFVLMRSSVGPQGVSSGTGRNDCGGQWATMTTEQWHSEAWSNLLDLVESASTSLRTQPLGRVGLQVTQKYNSAGCPLHGTMVGGLHFKNHGWQRSIEHAKELKRILYMGRILKV